MKKASGLSDNIACFCCHCEEWTKRTNKAINVNKQIDQETKSQETTRGPQAAAGQNLNQQRRMGVVLRQTSPVSWAGLHTLVKSTGRHRLKQQ